MKEDIGNLWEYPAQYRCVTTNRVIGIDGHLIMGAGVAREARKRFPGLPKKLGDWVLKYGNRPFLCKEEGLITFPTKRNWRDASDVKLIRESARLVAEMVDKFGITAVVLPAVGCGCGGLTWDFVKPYIEDVLDDRFTVIHKER